MHQYDVEWWTRPFELNSANEPSGRSASTFGHNVVPQSDMATGDCLRPFNEHSRNPLWCRTFESVADSGGWQASEPSVCARGDTASAQAHVQLSARKSASLRPGEKQRQPHESGPSCTARR